MMWNTSYLENRREELVHLIQRDVAVAILIEDAKDRVDLIILTSRRFAPACDVSHLDGFPGTPPFTPASDP